MRETKCTEQWALRTGLENHCTRWCMSSQFKAEVSKLSPAELSSNLPQHICLEVSNSNPQPFDYKPDSLAIRPRLPPWATNCQEVSSMPSKSLISWFRKRGNTKDAFVTNLVGVPLSTHHQMSLSLHPLTLTVALHLGLHLPSSTALIASAPITNQRQYKSPGLSPARHGTMSMSHQMNKSSHLDPLASRLTPSVTEYTVIQGSSNFFHGHHPGMDYTYLTVGSSFTVGVANEERDTPVMPVAQPARGVAGASERAHIMAANVEPARKMAAAPERDATNTPAAWPAHDTAALLEHAQAGVAALDRLLEMVANMGLIRKMAARTELRHVTAAIPEPYEVAAAFPDSSQVSKSSQATAAVPVSNQAGAVFPVQVNQVTEPPHKMAATPEPPHKMAATPEPPHKMAATPEPPHKMAATPEPPHKMAATPEPAKAPSVKPQPAQAISVKPQPGHVMFSAPESAPIMASLPEAVSESSHAPPDGPESSHVPSGLKSAPEVPSGLKSAPEVPSDHETDPEASPGGEAAPMPPEVSASDVDPPMEAASLYRLSASPQILSTSSVSAVSRSQAITQFPAPPQLPPGHKPAPERPPSHKPAPEFSPGHKPVPECHLVGEAAPIPPEVSAMAVDPPLEVASPYKLSASLPSLFVSSVSAFPRSQIVKRGPVPPRRAAAPPVPPRRAAAPPVPPRRAAAPPVPPRRAAAPPVPPRRAALPPVPPRRARASPVPPPAPPWRAPAPPALPPAPPWRAPAPSALPPALPPAPPWRAPAPPALPPAPPWRAPAPPAPPWRAPALPAPPPAPPWRVPALSVLPQSLGFPHGPGPPALALSPSHPTAPLDCCFFRASGSRSLGGGYVTNLVGVPLSTHHQMSLSLHPLTLTVALHLGLHLPSSTALIASAPITNQRQYKSPGLSPARHGVLNVYVLYFLAPCS
ncbi:hypothetical protein H4Q32_008435 [Labeo rohita]|uniref:Uncharacterized protein n=1 Tax=Labeo rohita TaxID=84645 RepID=A0ABQ8MD40_LABRO|nr:hypothetical protein H4Q32_008435 [Labeo rohita]